ncbi:MAG: response regulator transcription factor [Phycisphaerales bacterium]|nr:response regulator transcription factor [Phycisphaerales bacterium]
MSAERAPAVLVVEDDENLRVTLADNLEQEGYRVHSVRDGAAARAVLDAQRIDVVVLDIMLPDTDGYTLCARIRGRDPSPRVLMLTARSLEDDLVRGFDAGADDYLTKPFDTAELVVRLRALTRRHTSDEPTKLELGPIHLDLLTRQFKLDGRTVETTAREFSLIEFFLRRPNRVQSRHQIFENVWDVNYDENSNVLDVYISRIRKKLGAHSDYLRTVQGAGYMLTQPETLDD